MKKILLSLLAVLILIQFFRPEKNQSTAPSANDITARYEIPKDVEAILDKSCFDCHSNNTRYPWYNNIQPVAWWLQHHVNEGKAKLNFSEFLSYDDKKADHKMEEVIETVKEGEMPLNSYTWTHKEARLTREEKEKLVNWAQEIRRKIAFR